MIFVAATVLMIVFVEVEAAAAIVFVFVWVVEAALVSVKALLVGSCPVDEVSRGEAICETVVTDRETVVTDGEVI